MMTTIEINGKEYTLPATLDDIKFSEYVGIFQGISGKEEDTVDDKIQVVGRVLKEDRAFVESLPLAAFNLLFEKLAFLFKEPVEKASDSVILGGKTYTITPIEKWPFRKYIEAEECVKGGDKNYVQLLSIILTDNQGYTSDKARELARNIKDAKATDLIPLLAFFLGCRRLSEINTRLCSLIGDLAETVQSARNPRT